MYINSFNTTRNYTSRSFNTTHHFSSSAPYGSGGSAGEIRGRNLFVRRRLTLSLTDGSMEESSSETTSIDESEIHPQVEESQSRTVPKFSSSPPRIDCQVLGQERSCMAMHPRPLQLYPERGNIHPPTGTLSVHSHYIQSIFPKC